MAPLRVFLVVSHILPLLLLLLSPLNTAQTTSVSTTVLFPQVSPQFSSAHSLSGHVLHDSHDDVFNHAHNFYAHDFHVVDIDDNTFEDLRLDGGFLDHADHEHSHDSHYHHPHHLYFHNIDDYNGIHFGDDSGNLCRYYDLMTKNCGCTCQRCGVAITTPGNCNDDPNTNCAALVAECSLPDYDDLMNKYCPKTCGRCSQACFDADPNCPDWVANGFCTNPGYPDDVKKQYCAKSCNMC